MLIDDQYNPYLIKPMAEHEQLVKDRCEYKLEYDPNKSHGLIFTTNENDREWRCPHEQYTKRSDKNKLCIFHTDPEKKSEDETQRQFIKKVNQNLSGEDKEIRKSERQFIDAKFSTLDLSNEVLDSEDNHPIDLRGAEIEKLIMRRCVVKDPLYLFDLTVGNPRKTDEVCGNFKFVSFQDIVAFDYSIFYGVASFRQANFKSSVDFRNVEFKSEVQFTEAIFDGSYNSFMNITAKDSMDFRDADFRFKVYFHGSRLWNSTWVDATFRNKVLFRGIRESESKTRFQDASPKENIQSDLMRAKTSTVFLGGVNFEGADFQEDVDVHSCVFAGENTINFRDIIIQGDADFRECRFRGRKMILFSESVFKRNLKFEPRNIQKGCEVNFEKSEIVSGMLHQPKNNKVLRNENVIYDLKESVIGSVLLRAETESIFDHYRFLLTKFNGFDFGDPTHRTDMEKNDWTIHTVKRSSSEGENVNLLHKKLEITYLKAKNGANRTGENTAASEFFRKEMIYRRHAHVDNLAAKDTIGSYIAKGIVRMRNIQDKLPGQTNSQRVSSLPDPNEEEENQSRRKLLLKWFTNKFFSLTSGYGEKPKRVIGVSVFIMAVFSILFFILRNHFEIENPPENPLHYISISVESFSSLVLGGGTNVVNPLLRVLAAFEAFIGAFLIALFLFTLTRSVHR